MITPVSTVVCMIVMMSYYVDSNSPPAALISDADNAVTFTSLPLPEGPAMIKTIDYSQYTM